MQPPRLIFIIWLILTPSLFAADRVTLHLGRVAGADWSAESLDLELDWQQGAAAAFQMRVKSITHPALLTPLKELVISCQQGRVSDHDIACQKGVLHLPHPLLDDPQIPIRFKWNSAQQTLKFELNRLHFAAGQLQAIIQSNPEGWALNVKADALDMTAFYNQLRGYLPMLPEIELSGKIDLVASVSGAGTVPSKFQWHSYLHELAFSDGRGDYLGEGISGSLQGGFIFFDEEWQGDIALTLQQGELLSPYLYIGVEQQPLSINAQLNINQRQLQVSKLHYNHPGILAFTLSATLLKQPQWMAESFHLQIEPFAIQTLYEQYLLPTLAESMLASLAWAGQATLALSMQRDGVQRGVLNLNDVTVEEVIPKIDETEEAEEITSPRRSFALYGINGLLNWSSGEMPADSMLSWDGGHFMEGITFGRTALDLSLHEKSITLLNSAILPVLDGRLVLSTFNLVWNDDLRFVFGGALTAVSMEAFSHAMGWLPLSGTLSGGIPKATYQNDTFELEGAMMVDLFEGQTIIQNLRVDDPLGVWPTLHANVELKDLDLEALTRTFSFGKITGKLEGRIKDLYLENWQPVSFDARFATPEQDESRHRISQRAIDNISNLGGNGLSGALSRSFLSFFDEFRYARLGVSCRLENGVCELDGVEAAAQGSYLVKGSGIPRVDIVGFNHQVDWELLINKLTEIANSGVGNADFE